MSDENLARCLQAEEDRRYRAEEAKSLELARQLEREESQNSGAIEADERYARSLADPMQLQEELRKPRSTKQSTNTTFCKTASAAPRTQAQIEADEQFARSLADFPPDVPAAKQVCPCAGVGQSDDSYLVYVIHSSSRGKMASLFQISWIHYSSSNHLLHRLRRPQEESAATSAQGLLVGLTSL